MTFRNTAGALSVLAPDASETKAGNYFVSNYPPFSQWRRERAGEAAERLARPGAGNTPLGLYVHIPFCRKRCHFCYFKVYTERNAGQIENYLEAVLAEFSRMARTPFVAGRGLDFVYFGGGTPSYLSEKQLRFLMDGLRDALPWDTAREIAFECEPGTLSERKLRALRDAGVNRLSLGIEHFDDEILEVNNRAHRSAEIYRAYDWARKVGFSQINIDLIAGMVGETEQKWQAAIKKTIALEPDAVTVYQMEVPHNTTLSQRTKQNGAARIPVADWGTKRRWVAEAFEALEARGYSIGSAYTAVRDPVGMKFVYRDALWFGADMLGAGVSSFGHLDGVHYQNDANIDSYVETVARGEAPVFRAMTMNEEERMIRCFILQMKLGRLSKAWFLSRYGVDVFERWREELESYRRDGLLSIDGDELKLTRRGLLRIDGMLPAFFLPRHRDVRYT